MDFETFDKYTDATFARNFEGLDLYLNLSSEEMAMVKEENKWMQLDIYSDEARKTLVEEILKIPTEVNQFMFSNLTKELAIETDIYLKKKINPTLA